jgi:hypothetical protein
LGISALCEAVGGEYRREKKKTSPAPHRSKFGFHLVVPFEQIGCDNLRACAKDALAISGR